MKTHNFTGLILLLVMLSACASKVNISTTKSDVFSKVDSRDFSVIFNTAIPQRMQQVHLTSEYAIRIKNDSIFTFLPYYGVAHVAPYSTNEGGIKISEKITDFSETLSRKGDAKILRFKTKSSTIQFQFYLNIFDNGTTTLQVSSYDKDPIHFYGELK